jgi:alpha-tubulin suppressor-like RCC1 family protein
VLEYEKAGAWPKRVLPRNLYAWGSNAYGQLGDSTNTNRSSPVQVGALNNWLQAAAGYQLTAVVKNNGTLWSWGRNSNGQVGDGTVVNRSSPVQIGAATTWSKVSVGSQHSLAVRSTGELYGWGLNDSGGVGDGTVVNRSSPVQIGSLTNWLKVAGGGYHSASVKTNGTLWAWGLNDHGQIGDGTRGVFPSYQNRSSPVQIGSLTTWALVACGLLHTSAVKTDGTLWTWGSNNTGQIGDNTVVSRSSPVQVGAADWAQVACGRRQTIAVKTNGTLWTWGRNQAGQLGDNSVVNRSSPVQIGALTNWAQPATGATNYITAVVKADNTMWAWGENNAGQVGDNSVVNRSIPIQIGSLTAWESAAAGGSFVAAILKG